MSIDALFPAIDPWDQGWLDVGSGHRLHYEQSGIAEGVVALIVHGGPASGSSPRARRMFDPGRFRILTFDQRGCGRSTPHGALRENTTAELVEDIECLLDHVGVEACLVVGGSWGAALAIAWAARHPQRCLGALLRAPFLTGESDLSWFFDGAGALIPEVWCELAERAAAAGRETVWPWLPEAVLASRTDDEARQLIEPWMRWELALSSLGSAPQTTAELDDPMALRLAVGKYRVQAHYLLHHCFIGEESLLELASGLGAFPVMLLHGRADVVCRPVNAWKLHRRLPRSHLRWIGGVGHDPFAPAMIQAMREAGRQFLLTGDFTPPL